MMDGRVGAIRARARRGAASTDVAILAYAAKFASAYYGPFREAAESAPAFGDRRAYQMDPPNRREALREMRLDLEEGADVLMVKPALPYLDVLADARRELDVPLAAYHVSGEYAMIRAAAERGWIDGAARARGGDRRDQARGRGLDPHLRGEGAGARAARVADGAARGGRGTRYKVVETSDVSDVELERILNEWTAQGWTLDTRPVRDARVLEASGDGLRDVRAEGRRRGHALLSLRPARAAAFLGLAGALGVGGGLATAWLAPGWDAPALPEHVRFSLLAVGDSGHLEKASPWLTPQRAVGDALAATHRARPAAKLLLLGDNFYPDGLEQGEAEARIAMNLVAPLCTFLDLSAPQGAQVEPRCDVPAARRLPIPVRAVLGNHDWRAAESPDLEQDLVPAIPRELEARDSGAGSRRPTRA